ncbi:MAG: hypothetical protein OHK006_03410 [Thermodesulfovibrionales bacterium]
MKPSRKQLRWALAAFGFILAVLLAAVLLAPRLIDLEAVRAKIEQAVSRETGGKITFERMEVAVFPRPRAVFHNTVIDIPGRVSGSVARLEAFPRIMPLLGGSIALSSVHLSEPDLRIVIPKAQQEKKEEFSLSTLQGRIIEWSAKAAGLSVSVSGGSLLLKHEDGDVGIRELDAKLSAGLSDVSVRLEASTEATGRFSLRGRLSPETFAGDGDLRVSRLRTQLLPQKMMAGALSVLEETDGDLRLKWRAKSISDLALEAEAEFPRLVLKREGGRIDLQVKALDASSQIREGGIVLAVKKLRLAKPGLSLAGSLDAGNAGGQVSLEIRGEDLDVTAIRETALAFASDVPVVRNIFRYVEAGAIPRISFRSAGPTLADLGKTANFRIEGRLDKGTVFVPGPALRITDVNADAVIENGILTASNVVSEMQKIRGTAGSVRVGLKGKDAPLHIETTVRADAGAVHGLLVRLIRNQDVVRELGRISSMNGSLEGRLVLGERVDAVDVIADVAKMKFSAAYERLPAALAIESGRIHYDRALISAEELTGRIGRTTFSNLSGQVRTAEEPRLEVRSAAGSLDLGQIFPWLSATGGSGSPLGKFRAMQGRLDLASVSISGPLQKPETWSFSAAASPKTVVLHAAGLPSPAALDNGTIMATQEKLDFSGVNAQMLDASFRLAGSLTGYLHDLSRIESTGEGVAGARSTGWVFEKLQLSGHLKPQAKIVLTNARAVWEKDKKTVFQGAMELSGGLHMDLHVEAGPDLLVVESAGIRDALSDASVSFKRSGREISVGFKGTLHQKTLVPLVVMAVPEGARAEGEFSARLLPDDLAASTAQGTIRGVQFPADMFGIERIDRISLQARDRELHVEAADFSYAGNSFTVSGNIGAVRNTINLDLDVSAGRIVWDEIAKKFGVGKEAGGPAEKTMKKQLTMQGIIRLKAEKFLYRRLEASPVEAVIRPAPEMTRVSIVKAGVCGIGTTGEIEFSAGGTGIDITLDAKNLGFKPTVVCLSKSRADASGTFTLQGRLKAHGKAGELLRTMSGKFDFTARDGRISRYRTLDSVFDFMNNEEELKGQVPDLDKEELVYSLLMVKGEIGRGVLTVQEGVLDSGRVEIVGQGAVDLVDGGIDLNLLVAPLRSLNKAVESIPVVGTVLGGSLVSVPVKVTGATSDPKVSYLSASGAVSNLTGMMSRTLKLPLNIFSPFMPKGKDKPQD